MDLLSERGQRPWFVILFASMPKQTAGLSGASHAVYVSRPKEVAALIEEAATHTHRLAK
ncbi:MAG: hypothetical protein QOJ58_5052 [Alphaproteobacteria bacterium]|nr:hypothetical protein [Alphaproteobacteria bacterium]